MKLEVGMYVRTDNGIIGKIYEKIGDMFTYKDSNRDYITYGLLHTEIIKASHNIIDLIEVGDYVNDNRVITDVYRTPSGNFVEVDSRYIVFGWGTGMIPENEIETIVTKEQFCSMEYKINE